MPCKDAKMLVFCGVARWMTQIKNQVIIIRYLQVLAMYPLKIWLLK